ncbi:hypothetical protein M193_gp103 [Halorubrum tailed phage 7]|uniref:hypothetical protein n=1 Tax=Halorubrum tailed phage 7 TaxID=2847108 RepID=UPI0003348EA5|nr:hypothetical protein M193_gp103 [Halorubrum tailed phage 7]AGM10942.1 hypothetical protein HRTV7_71 [Halorubrum tailed phage 7]
MVPAGLCPLVSMEHISEKQPPSVLTSDTENATTIQPSEAPPSQREKYKRLRAYNTGLWNGPKRENKAAIRRQDNLHRYDAIAGQADLTPYQKERGRELFDSLNIRKIGLPADHIAFAICILVANADVPDGTRYWPHPDGKGDKPFERLSDSLDLSVSKQMSAVMKMKHRTGL